MLENYDIARSKKFYKILDEILTIKDLSEILYAYAQYNVENNDECAKLLILISPLRAAAVAAVEFSREFEDVLYPA